MVGIQAISKQANSNKEIVHYIGELLNYYLKDTLLCFVCETSLIFGMEIFKRHDSKIKLNTSRLIYLPESFIIMC